MVIVDILKTLYFCLVWNVDQYCCHFTQCYHVHHHTVIAVQVTHNRLTALDMNSSTGVDGLQTGVCMNKEKVNKGLYNYSVVYVRA